MLFDGSPHRSSPARRDGNLVVDLGLSDDQLQIFGLLQRQISKSFQRLAISFFGFFEASESLLNIADPLSRRRRLKSQVGLILACKVVKEGQQLSQQIGIGRG